MTASRKLNFMSGIWYLACFYWNLNMRSAGAAPFSLHNIFEFSRFAEVRDALCTGYVPC
jgi:hypothetical protein